jgi:hypothetical protein
MIALMIALMLQAASVQSQTPGEPIPGIPGTADAAKYKHDTAKNAVGNVRAVAGDPIPGMPPTPSPRPPAAASDPIPGVETPTTRHPGAKEAKPVCVPSPTKACPKDASSSPT